MTHPKPITVFTPAFNRAYCLHQVYESLVRQTNRDFCWLLVDDGSTDNTKELVETWVAENKLQIQYVYQENQGMHGAHNTAYETINTELNVCIDSDDYMPDDAIENILNYWKLYGSNKVAGLVGLDIDKEGQIIGSEIPEQLKSSTLGALYHQHKVTGDKKLVLRTEIIKNYPKYPLFEGERFVPLGTLYLMIDQDYELLCVNKPLCVVEYLADGSSLNMFKQYRRHPKGFRFSRLIELTYVSSYKVKIVKALHLISSTLYIGDFNFFKNNPEKIVTLCCLPFGVLFHGYLKFNSNR